MTLHDHQRVFWQSVRTRPGPPELEAVFVSRGALSAHQRLEIYRTAYWVRQVQALRELFPAVVAATGDARFAQLASRFVAEQPSTHWALERIGPPFVDWLREKSGFGGVAALDWARFAVFVAPDVELVDREALRARPLDAWVVRTGQHVAACAVDASHEQRCVWRQGFRVFDAPLPLNEANALAAASRGVDFPTWCQLVVGDDVHGPDFVLATLERWLSRGWLVNS